MVDKDFGTGCVKITPAHDRADFKARFDQRPHDGITTEAMPRWYFCLLRAVVDQAGRRHGLKQLNIFTEDGRINELLGFMGVQQDAKFLCRGLCK